MCVQPCCVAKDANINLMNMSISHEVTWNIIKLCSQTCHLYLNHTTQVDTSQTSFHMLPRTRLAYKLKLSVRQPPRTLLLDDGSHTGRYWPWPVPPTALAEPWALCCPGWHIRGQTETGPTTSPNPTWPPAEACHDSYQTDSNISKKCVCECVWVCVCVCVCMRMCVCITLCPFPSLSKV